MAKKSICAKFFCPKNGFFGSKKFYRPKQPAKREDNIIETMLDDAPKAQGTTRQKIFFEIFFAPTLVHIWRKWGVQGLEAAIQSELASAILGVIRNPLGRLMYQIPSVGQARRCIPDRNYISIDFFSSLHAWEKKSKKFSIKLFFYRVVRHRELGLHNVLPKGFLMAP